MQRPRMSAAAARARACCEERQQMTPPAIVTSHGAHSLPSMMWLRPLTSHPYHYRAVPVCQPPPPRPCLLSTRHPHISLSFLSCSICQRPFTFAPLPTPKVLPPPFVFLVIWGGFRRRRVLGWGWGATISQMRRCQTPQLRDLFGGGRCISPDSVGATATSTIQQHRRSRHPVPQLLRRRVPSTCAS